MPPTALREEAAAVAAASTARDALRAELREAAEAAEASRQLQVPNSCGPNHLAGAVAPEDTQCAALKPGGVAVFGRDALSHPARLRLLSAGAAHAGRGARGVRRRAGESCPAAATPVENPYCSCMLTRVRQHVVTPAHMGELKEAFSQLRAEAAKVVGEQPANCPGRFSAMARPAVSIRFSPRFLPRIASCDGSGVGGPLLAQLARRGVSAVSCNLLEG